MPYLFQRRHAGGRPVQRDGSPWLRPAVAVRPNPRQFLLVFIRFLFTCTCATLFSVMTFLCLAQETGTLRIHHTTFFFF